MVTSLLPATCSTPSRKGHAAYICIFNNRAIPIIAVFTPATLTIQQAKDLAPSIHRMSLPLVNFSSPFIFTRYSTSATADGPTGPSIALARLMSSVAAQGAVLPLEMPFSDAPKVSYNLSFHGPSVSCGPLGGNSSFSRRVR